MPRIVVRLSEEEYNHIAQLAEAADVDDADIIRGLVELDMRGQKQKGSEGTAFLNGLLEEIKSELNRLGFKPPSAVNDKAIGQSGRRIVFTPDVLKRVKKMIGDGMRKCEIAKILRNEGLKFDESALRYAIKRNGLSNGS